MRTQTREYLQKFLEEHKGIKNLLDVGSLATENGAHIRDIVEKHGIKYWGVDMRQGDNVDLVVNGHELSRKIDKGWSMVVCFDTFEHDDAFWLTLKEMKKVLKKGGWLMLGFPSRYCPEHNHPQDYWRFMPQSMELMFKGFENFQMIVDKNNEMEDEIYGWGQKA